MMALLVPKAALATVSLIIIINFLCQFPLFFSFLLLFQFFFCMFLSFSLSLFNFASLHFFFHPPVCFIILLEACNYGGTDDWLKHNWIFLLPAFPKEKLPQWHVTIWKSHSWVANWWGLSHRGANAPRQLLGSSRDLFGQPNGSRPAA